MKQINIHTAKTQLSKLIAEGKEIVITRYGHPVARLVPIKPLQKDREPGTAKGRVKMMESFFDALPENMRVFSGRVNR
jgi:prevent-host-death family protein